MNTPTPAPSAGELLAVTQADRDAAAGFYQEHLARPNEVPVAAAMRVGHVDDSPLIQAFARHRLAHSAPKDSREASGLRSLERVLGFEVDGPCPICRGIEGCSHTLRERCLAALSRSHSAPADAGGGVGEAAAVPISRELLTEISSIIEGHTPPETAAEWALVNIGQKLDKARAKPLPTTNQQHPQSNGKEG